VAQQAVTQERIAEARCKIDMARLLTLKAAWMMDVAGNKVAKTEIAMIKVVAPSMACQVIDWAMQVHGGGGMCDDFPLAYAYAQARTLRFADGPDEVHRAAIAKWSWANTRHPRRTEQTQSTPCGWQAAVEGHTPVRRGLQLLLNR
jgi:acyl-CoA dehydrogenase